MGVGLALQRVGLTPFKLRNHLLTHNEDLT
jgi:hypothetical protein